MSCLTWTRNRYGRMQLEVEWKLYIGLLIEATRLPYVSMATARVEIAEKLDTSKTFDKIGCLQWCLTSWENLKS